MKGRIGRLESAMEEATLRQQAMELASREGVGFDEALDGLHRWRDLQRRYPPIRRPDGRWDVEPTIRGYHEEQGLRGEALYEAVRDFCLSIAERLPGGMEVEIRPSDYGGPFEGAAESPRERAAE